MATKKRYQTWTLERHVLATRENTWEAMLEFLETASGGYDPPGDPAPHGPGATISFSLDGVRMVERTITLEPPWRRVYEVTEGAPIAFYQGTTVLRDDGDECHLSWAAVYDPLPDGGSDGFPERSRQAVEKGIDRIVELAESR